MKVTLHEVVHYYALKDTYGKHTYTPTYLTKLLHTHTCACIHPYNHIHTRTHCTHTCACIHTHTQTHHKLPRSPSSLRSAEPSTPQGPNHARWKARLLQKLRLLLLSVLLLPLLLRPFQLLLLLLLLLSPLLLL